MLSTQHIWVKCLSDNTLNNVESWPIIRHNNGVQFKETAITSLHPDTFLPVFSALGITLFTDQHHQRTTVYI